MTQLARLPTFFIPHGGGPCFFIRPDDQPAGMPRDFWTPLAEYLRGVGRRVPRPDAVVVVTAHWLTQRPTVGTASDHALLYDYYNFPPYTYQLDYPAKGSPMVAARIVALLGEAGIACDTDDARGIDHGVFVPFKLIYPDADVPIVPLSLRRDLAADAHLAIGRALAPLRDENVLIVGSGMSFHNMRAMMMGSHDAESFVFDDWLVSAATDPDPARRDARLGDWASAPAARIAHPDEEHLIPLMVAAGAAARDVGRHDYGQDLGGKAVSAFRFG